ncbi:uncharacterized protein HMPREF1541_08314 [Cyphellophora europaea CBS 101466]|uniref:Uncharacterized protein n=1 Tax=Cyphellophora europaea (strain CBS 101466) TaxID=1220924 RepID=W2RNQ0_CYPE1|nr:uncharacterized protein HMPREF1541_08314 [Cyphellophora europaea CBS 101466]ETN37323.1 hypothetical protein HMPREF1541_08314 [Cyphellophora europaea CBS 101466]
MSGQPVSHGRGGAANIRPDDTPYIDGEIVREGLVGDQGDGKYSAGRGGQGNITGEPVKAPHAPHDSDMVPETAMRVEKEESHHFGRGGAGNEAHVHEKKEGASLIDKAKHALHMDKK